MPLSTHFGSASRSPSDQATLRAIAHAGQPLTGAPAELDELVTQMGAARFALIGEATHGSHEFYETRAAITRQLIESHSLNAIAVEADWPDAWRVNCYVRGLPGGPEGRADTHGAAALGGFSRFPAWMWRNTVVLEFIEWLRAYNEGLPGDEQVGFYGIDLYSLYGSIDTVLRELDKTDPAAAARARARYACFEHFRGNTQAYAYAAHFETAETCEDAVVAQLVELQQAHSAALAHGLRSAGSGAGKHADMPASVKGHPNDGDHAGIDARFNAEQNARVVRNAERYYRHMFGSRVSSWNLRDQHMAETIDALDLHLRSRRGGRPPKLAVWAHNSHLGDARATEMGERGELNLGQLLRERHGREVFTLGFSTYTGTVTAAPGWGEPAQTERVRPALPDSTEGLLHEVLFHTSGAPRLLLPLRDQPELASALEAPRLQRAIGVVYAPQTERQSHYFDARLPEQYDALIHIDTTRALEPLASAPLGNELAPNEVPETYPSGT
jgi:erythromycin esterase-like protein